MRDAYRMAVAACSKDPNATDDDLDDWFSCLTSVPFTIKVVTKGLMLGSLFDTIVQAREDIGVKWENMRMTNLLRSYEVMDLKAQLEPVQGKMKNQQVAGQYGRVKLSKSSEAVSATFVEVTVMLHGGAFKVKEVRDVCFEFDRLGLDNPMDSIHKIREVVMGCNKDTDDMKWVFPMMLDWWKVTGDNEGISLRSLKGTVPGHGGKSIIDLFLFKRVVRDNLYKVMEKYAAWDLKVKLRIREFTVSIEACRASMGSADNAEMFPGKDISERATWPKSADLLAKAFEVLVFGYAYDVLMKTNIKNKKTAEDFLAQPDICKLLEVVDSAYTAENVVPEEQMDDEKKEEEEEVTLETAMAAIVDLTKSTAELLLQHNCNKMPTDERERVDNKARGTLRDIKGVVTLIPEPKTADELTQFMKDSTAGQVRAKGKFCHTGCILDGKLLCECGSQGKYRHPPTRQTQLTKLLSAFVQARGGELDANDCVVAMDGSKGKDFEDKLGKAFQNVHIETQKQFAIYTYESVQARLERDHGGVLDLMETIHLLSLSPLNIDKRPRKHCEDQNTRGNVIGPLAVPPYIDSEANWQLPLNAKKMLFGAANLPLPGGPCPVAHEKSRAPRQFDMVPAFYHEGPYVLDSEINHTLRFQAIIDLTPASGHWAMIAIREHIPYFGVCFTQEHVDLLYSRLVTRCLAAKLDANDAMYDADLANALTKHAEVNDRSSVFRF